jgi:hypothetical protein
MNATAYFSALVLTRCEAFLLEAFELERKSARAER